VTEWKQRVEQGGLAALNNGVRVGQLSLYDIWPEPLLVQYR
jgi:hypothetical protein